MGVVSHEGVTSAFHTVILHVGLQALSCHVGFSHILDLCGWPLPFITFLILMKNSKEGRYGAGKRSCVFHDT